MRFPLYTILFIFICGATTGSEWTGIRKCGSYQLNGTIRSVNSSLVVVINEKTQSEFVIHVDTLSESQLAPYLDQPISAIANFEATNELKATISSINARIPNLLSPKDTGARLITARQCR